MTPPSIDSARELLVAAATQARASGDPVNELAAAAIDVVLARLDHVETMLEVHERHLTAWAAKPVAPPRPVVATRFSGQRTPQIGDAVDRYNSHGVPLGPGTIVRIKDGPLPYVVRSPDGVETGHRASELIVALPIMSSIQPAEAKDPPATQRQSLANARLREISGGVDIEVSAWPDDSKVPSLADEMQAMATELLSARNALHYHEAAARLRSQTVVPFLDERGQRIGDAFVDGLQVLARVTDPAAAAVLRANCGRLGVSLGYTVEPEPAAPPDPGAPDPVR
jgi:hypothetical protein